MKEKNINFLLKMIICLIVLFLIFSLFNTSFANSETRDNSQKQYCYLSDIKYITTQSSVGWGSITYDKNLDTKYNDGLITVIVDGKPKKFLKGVAAHATSTVVYDITDYDYDYFTAYIGVDASRGAGGNGVKFSIYTSVDGQNWNLKTPVSPQVMKGNTEAQFVKIDIKEANYLKLYAHSNGNIDSDHSVYANAKLIKEGYEENNSPADFIKTIDEYDNAIKAHYGEEITGEYELLLLQREFVKNIGYDILQAYVQIDENNMNVVSWLMNDVTNLRLYIVGGRPTGSYRSSLDVLNRLYTEYKEDLNNETVTSNGVVLSDLYRKMMISLSLTHSAQVSSWIGGSGANISNPVTRYQIYKEMNLAGLLDNKVFENLNVEEMRWVMNNQIADEEIKWLNNHVRRRNNSRDPYTYIAYGFGYNYNKDIYYSEANYEKWNQKYLLDQFDLTYKKGVPKLWIVFEEGSVCGGLSKTGSNINAAYGVPSAVIGQPGHAAYLQYSENADGIGFWNIYNDVSGWTQSEKGERMLLGWGSTNWDSYYQVPYVLLAQAALNDFDSYEKSAETLLLKNIYSNNLVELENIYRKALEQQNINLDAWYGLITTFKANPNKTEEDYFQLVEEMSECLKYYPLPMWDLWNLVKGKFTSPAYIMKFNLLEKRTLEEATRLTSGTSQPSVTRIMANYLLGRNNYTLTTFSFDGPNAESIVLSDKFAATEVRWDYSLDGGETWTETGEHIHKLNKEEIAKINVEDGILIHIIGVNYSEANINKIVITKASVPNVYNNDLENRVIGTPASMQWRFSADDEWILFENELPDLTGDKTIEVRQGPTGTRLASDTKTLSFTQDVVNNKRKYIPIANLSLHSVSSQATAGDQKGHAINAIDGNAYTRWHSAWNGSDTTRTIVIQFDKLRNLTALDYIPEAGVNGKIFSAQVLVSVDGTNWKEVVSGTNWSYSNVNDVSTKTVDFEAVRAKYVKIVGKRTQTVGGGSFITAAMFNFYEDTTVDIVAEFTFDGANAKKIVLDNDYKGQNWQYSLDGGTTWKNGSGDEHLLTDTEINQITSENQIKIRFAENSTQYIVKIKKMNTPTITPYLNDWENRLIGITNKAGLEWKIEGTNNWTDFTEEEPVVEGAKKLYVRAKATSNFTASDILEYQFAEDENTSKETYIPISHLSVHAYSTQSIDNTRPFYAQNAIDGNRNTLWHTDFRYSIVGSRAFITMKLDSNKYISALEYAQKKYREEDPCYIKNAYVYISENGEDWILAGTLENATQDEEFKKIIFDESVSGQYVKIEMEGYGIFASIAMINLYEDTTVKKAASFLFDGEEANKIILLDEFKGSNWEYSLDGGNTWKRGSSDTHTLTEEEIEQVNGDNKIRLKINNNEYVINIQKSSRPVITGYLNDLENRLIGMDNTDNLEWKIESDGVSTNKWIDYSEQEPIVEGNAKLLIRKKAKNVFAASEVLELIFTEDNQADTRKYVPVKCLSIANVSAEDKGQNGAAINAIDGNYNTRWLNSSAGTDNQKYIVIKFDSAIYLSAMDYVPHSENGKILTGKIEGSMDGENFTDISEITGWGNNQDIKNIDFNEPVKVRYVKITGIETSYTSNKRHIGARMFNFYEDITKKDAVAPTAEIQYNIETLTNNDVVATLVNPSTEITVLNNGGNMSYTFTENGTFTFEFEDSEGNKGRATATVDWICKTLPNAMFTYDITDPTNQDVTVTVTFDREGTIVTNNDGNNTHTFTENGEFTFEFRGPYGNKGTATARVDWICKTLPNATLTYDIEETTNKPVTVTIAFDREGTRVTNNNGKNIYTFEKNGEFTFEFVGPYGNTGVATAKVDWIDKTIPKADIKYDITEKTNKNVVATLEVESDDIIITNNNGSNTYTFTENGTFTFEFRNELGNKGTAIAKVDWIDKKTPNGRISYNITKPTNQLVEATISFDKENVTITNNKGKNTYTFNKNGEFTFEFIDEAGNTGSALAKVTWIDKTLPVATITYSSTTPTNKDVIATISFDKENITVNGGNTHTFTENGTYEFQFTGPAGNSGVAKAEVTWIDKETPEPLLVYSTVQLTNKDVIATVIFEDEQEGEVTILNNNKKNSYVFSENGSFTFEFSDRAGNKGKVTANVTCIDKLPPTAVVKYNITDKTNKNVEASLVDVSEEITITNNESSTYTFTKNGIFTFEFTDKAGNKGTAEAKVDWIDKVVPVATIEYSTTELTNKDVIATISFDKENVTVEGGNTHIFNENGEFTFEYVDEAGNNGMATAIVNWINKDLEIISSTKYKIENGFISGIRPKVNEIEGTTVKEFKENIETKEEVVVLNKDGIKLNDNEIITTDSKLKVGEKEYTLIVKGDIDCDGEITINDLAKIKLHYIEKILLNGTALKSADMDGDSEVTINDIAILKLVLIGLKNID
ncbi:MAG: hypothetical protein HFJ57_07585 [Clostridia bacterium]|nr:hypothetical protein [Clostridia bacterium]MCI9287791.1 hypothetical protein [Clostridia bacterium]